MYQQVTNQDAKLFLFIYALSWCMQLVEEALLHNGSLLLSTDVDGT
jgi:hypothetical protein